jgi:AraC-like DNA-binding protein
MLPDAMDEAYLRYMIWLSQEFMEKYAELFPYPFTKKQQMPSMLRTKNTKWEHLGALFQYGVREAEEREDGWEAIVLGNTMQLLAQIKRAVNAESAEAPVAEKTELLARLAEYIERHYTETITIGDLSRQFYVSKSTISHLFQQKLGVSLYRYITQRRLIAAKSLIEEGIRLEEVAMRIGFQDYTAFFRAFKGAFGISPRQYRVMQGVED